MEPELRQDNKAVLNDEGQAHFVFDRRVDYAFWIGDRLTIAVNAGAGYIRELVICEFKEKLAMTLRWIFLNDGRLPACWSTINQSCSHDGARFRVLPDGPCRLNYQTGIETGLLVSRWS